MNKLLLLFGILIFCGLQWGMTSKTVEDIEAVDDFGTTEPGKPVSINLLTNDKGEEIEITQIVTPASCGETSEWEADGTITYTADENTTCTLDIFQYEIKDSFGETDTATVIIVISDPNEFAVEVERDCLETHETGYYILEIFIWSGVPPFVIDINGEKDTVSELGKVSYEILETGNTQEYDIIVTDSVMQEYSWKTALNPCFYWLCDEIFYFKKEITCLGNGQVKVELFNSNIEEAYWMDFDGGQHEMEKVDTLFDLSYLFVALDNGFVFDTLLNCLTAHDDFFEIPVETPFTFSVLENDFGQEIKVSQIIKTPNCGDLIEWSPKGEMAYEFARDSDCQKDTIIYELENAIGEKTTAMVQLNNMLEKDLSITWDTYCEESWSEEILLSFQIHGGTPPYELTGIINATYNDPEPEIAISFFVNETGFLEVIDSKGQMSLIEIDTKFACVGDPNECYEPRFIHQYLKIECLETGGIIHFLERMNTNILDKAFWIDPENNYHELSELDTLPNYSYYYFQFKRLGHIDGYINCLTTDIEETTSPSPSNSFLQLYPNPNNGQFSLQLQTSNPSLQSYPVQVYNTAGQSIWKGTLQSNRLETLNLGNVGSGLYVLQVVMEKEVLVERFWVE